MRRSDRRIFRRCQECGAVHPAGAFSWKPGPLGAGRALDQLRCPACGHVGPRVGFPAAEPPDGEPT